MPTYCSVPLCSSYLQSFRFPTDAKLRAQWVQAIKRANWKAKSYSAVCKLHFQEDDFLDITKTGTRRRRMRLKPGAVPSIFEWTSEPSESSIARKKRMVSKGTSLSDLNNEEQKSLEVGLVIEDDLPIIEEDLPLASSIEVASSSTDFSVLPLPVSNSDLNFLHSVDMESMNILDDNNCVLEDDVEAVDPCARKQFLGDLSKGPMSQGQQTHCRQGVDTELFFKPYICIDRIKHSPDLVLHYTGLECFDKFISVFNSLGPNVNHLNYLYSKTCDTEPLTCFLLMLVYLRCHYPIEELSRMFSISRFCVSNIVFTWIKFCALQWREIDIWPSKDAVNFFFPLDFKHKCENTRVIIDGTEIPIQRPCNPHAQRSSFSSYKHRNTMKVLVGATPGGMISFVSDAYGGSASDRQLVERSTLLHQVEKGDVIMADKGFNVQDMFATKDVSINIPTFFKKCNRLAPSTVSHDKVISSKRVHIERLIGIAKTYKILKSPLGARETALASEIVFVCFMMVNFKNNIVSPFA